MTCEWLSSVVRKSVSLVSIKIIDFYSLPYFNIHQFSSLKFKDTLLSEMASSKCVVGVCYQMCSEREMKWRERNGLLHYFEISDKRKNEAKADPRKVVKEYSRSAAGKKMLSPKDLRPSPVLLETMNYLIEEIIPRTELPWVAVYDFVNDRIQAIRQDMTVQMIEDDNAVQILEKCVRFYITASYLLCEEHQSEFDQHLNSQQLSICLEKLFVLYKKLKSDHLCEFIAIYFAENAAYSETLYRSISVFSDYLSDDNINLSIKICTAYVNKNFKRFFNLAKKLPTILVLCFFHHFSSIRYQALETLNDAFSSKLCKLPVDVLCSWLSVSGKNHMVQLCQNCDMKVDDTYVYCDKKTFSKVSDLSLKRETFIDSKLIDISLSQLINGL